VLKSHICSSIRQFAVQDAEALAATYQAQAQAAATTTQKILSHHLLCSLPDNLLCSRRTICCAQSAVLESHNAEVTQSAVQDGRGARSDVFQA
jgi:hypothetical protein